MVQIQNLFHKWFGHVSVVVSVVDAAAATPAAASAAAVIAVSFGFFFLVSLVVFVPCVYCCK